MSYSNAADDLERTGPRLSYVIRSRAGDVPVFVDTDGRETCYPGYLTVLELLDALQAEGLEVPRHARRGLIRKCSAALRAWTYTQHAELRRCPITGTWVFSREVISTWRSQEGDVLIQTYIGAKWNRNVVRLFGSGQTPR